MEKGPFNKIYLNTQNSYKFYWWLSILEIVVEEKKARYPTMKL